jgi:hypothetical protein
MTGTVENSMVTTKQMNHNTHLNNRMILKTTNSTLPNNKTTSKRTLSPSIKTTSSTKMSNTTPFNPINTRTSTDSHSSIISSNMERMEGKSNMVNIKDKVITMTNNKRIITRFMNSIQMRSKRTVRKAKQKIAETDYNVPEQIAHSFTLTIE